MEVEAATGQDRQSGSTGELIFSRVEEPFLTTFWSPGAEEIYFSATNVALDAPASCQVSEKLEMPIRNSPWQAQDAHSIRAQCPCWSSRLSVYLLPPLERVS